MQRGEMSSGVVVLCQPETLAVFDKLRSSPQGPYIIGFEL